MDSATISLAASMNALTHQMAGVAHNLANVNSTAFKRRSGTIDSFIVEFDRAGAPAVSFPIFQESSDFRQGDPVTNGNSLNIALTGPGFIQLENPLNPGEILYTRSGTLARSAKGFLITQEGYRLLSSAGTPINIGQAGELQIRTTGDIVNKETGAAIGDIGLVRFDDVEKLQAMGAALYRKTAASGEPRADRFTTLQQGGLERSNVEAISEMIQMITVQRHFSAVARTLTTIAQTVASLNTLAQG